MLKGAYGVPRTKKADNPNNVRPVATKRTGAAGCRKKIDAKKGVSEELINFDVTKLPKLYKCTCCGAIYPNVAEQRFFIVPHTTVFDGNDRYSSICVKCAVKYYNEYTSLYNNRKFAMLLICSMIGAYFSEKLFEQMQEKDPDVPLGHYLRYLNGTQYKNKTFQTYLLEMKNQEKTFIPKDKMQELMEGNWTAADRKNKNYVIHSLGYDPFDDTNYSDADRKYLYNTMSGYLSDDVLEDPHKIMSVVNIVKSSLQLTQCDMLINKQIKSVSPDMDEIKSMTDTKNGLQRSINAIAKENAISAVGSGKKSKATLALTAIMKEMLDRGIMDAKPNLADTKMSEAYQHIAQISHRALMTEMNFTTDEYAKMVAEQSEIITTQNDRIVRLEEELRLARIEVDHAHKAGFKTQGLIKVQAADASNMSYEAGEDDADIE